MVHFFLMSWSNWSPPMRWTMLLHSSWMVMSQPFLLVRPCIFLTHDFICRQRLAGITQGGGDIPECPKFYSGVYSGDIPEYSGIFRNLFRIFRCISTQKTCEFFLGSGTGENQINQKSTTPSIPHPKMVNLDTLDVGEDFEHTHAHNLTRICGLGHRNLFLWLWSFRRGPP